MIDLGVVGRGGPPRPVATQRPVRRPGRAAGALITVAALFAVGGGSTVHPGPAFLGPVTVPAAGVPDVIAVEDTLYLSRREAILAYSLRTGALRWTVPMPPRSGLVVLPIGGLVLIGINGSHWETIAVDRDTGTARWRADGIPLPLGEDPNRVALASAAVFNDDLSGDGPPRMTIVDAGTGAELARVPVAAGHGGPTFLPVVASTLRGPQVVGVRTFTAAGEPRWYDLAAGTERALPPTAITDEFLAVDDVLVAASRGGRDVRAYGQRDVALRWTLSTRSPVSVTVCGADVCVSEPDVTRAVDPRTGAVRWTSPWTNVTGAGRRLLGYRYGPVGPIDVAVLDAHNGQDLLRLPDWRPARTDDPAWVPVLRPLGPSADRYELAMLSAESATAYPVAVLAGRVDCRGLPGYVVCQTERDGIKVWRHRGT
jgi:outer membrane protein assembly factor BamB